LPPSFVLSAMVVLRRLDTLAAFAGSRGIRPAPGLKLLPCDAHYRVGLSKLLPAADVQRFAQRYVALSVLARRHHLNSGSLARYLTEAGTPPLSIPSRKMLVEAARRRNVPVRKQRWTEHRLPVGTALGRQAYAACPPKTPFRVSNASPVPRGPTRPSISGSLYFLYQPDRDFYAAFTAQRLPLTAWQRRGRCCFWPRGRCRGLDLVLID